MKFYKYLSIVFDDTTLSSSMIATPPVLLHWTIKNSLASPYSMLETVKRQLPFSSLSIGEIELSSLERFNRVVV